MRKAKVECQGMKCEVVCRAMGKYEKVNVLNFSEAGGGMEAAEETGG